MKTKFFSPRLYWEKMRQLRTVGFVSMALLSLAALQYVLTVLPYSESFLLIDTGCLVGYSPDRSFSDYLGPLMMVVSVSLIVCTALRFNNRRTDSDFYHALPHTRTCQFCSSFAAAQSWILLGVLAMFATALLGCTFSNEVTWEWSTVATLLFNLWSAGFGAGCAIALGMAMSGQSGVGLIWGLAVMVGPRWILSSLSSALVKRFSFLITRSLHPILTTPFNLTNSYLFDSSASPYLEWQNGVYTLLIALLPFALALLLFARRKSETAEQAAPSRTLQAVFRIGVCSLPCFILLCSLFGDKFWETSTVILVYALTLVLFFLYELLSTKNVKNLVRIIPQVFILAAINLLMYGGLHLIGNVYASFTPSAQQIQSVQIYWQSIKKYALGTQVRIQDEQLFDIVSKALKDTVDGKKSGILREFIIHSEQGSAHRYIILTNEEIEKITDIATNNADYCRAFTKLPSPDTLTRLELFSSSEAPDTVFSKQLYISLLEEIKTADPVQCYQALSAAENTKINGHDVDREVLTATFRIDGKYVNCNLPIFKELTPNTYQMYLRERWEGESKGRDRLYANLRYIEEPSILSVYKPASSDAQEFYFSERYKKGQSPQWMEVLVQAHKAGSLDPEQTYYPYIVDLYPRAKRTRAVLFMLTEPFFG